MNKSKKCFTFQRFKELYSNIQNVLSGFHSSLPNQNYLKEQKESRKSNVLVTMLYLGQGKSGTTQDDMKVLQQKCGGENICVFKGSVQPGGNNTRHCRPCSHEVKFNNSKSS